MSRALLFLWHCLGITACFLTGRGEQLMMAWEWEKELRKKRAAEAVKD